MTTEQKHSILNLKTVAKARLLRIKGNKSITELSNEDYAKHEYWAGKLIGINATLQALDIHTLN